LTDSAAVLALDMACGEIAVCVQRGESSFFSSISAASQQGKMRSTVIVPLMNDVLSQAGLSWHQLDALVLGAGPGSFTGLRIAAATLAGVNSALALPILHVSSLAITARQTNMRQVKMRQTKLASSESIWVLEDARAGEVFVGHYQAGQALQADACLNWQDIEAMSGGLFCCHTEPPQTLNQWTREPLTLQRSAALALEVQSLMVSGELKLEQSLVYPEAVYLQVSQAERHGRA